MHNTITTLREYKNVLDKQYLNLLTELTERGFDHIAPRDSSGGITPRSLYRWFANRETPDFNEWLKDNHTTIYQVTKLSRKQSLEDLKYYVLTPREAFVIACLASPPNGLHRRALIEYCSRIEQANEHLAVDRVKQEEKEMKEYRSFCRRLTIFFEYTKTALDYEQFTLLWNTWNDLFSLRSFAAIPPHQKAGPERLYEKLSALSLENLKAYIVNDPTLLEEKLAFDAEPRKIFFSRKYQADR